MGTMSGTQSFLAWGQQASFGTPQTTLDTAGNLRSGDVITNPATVHPRLSTGGSVPIASADQSWEEYLVSDWSAGFEYASNPKWQGLLTAVFGKVNVTTGTRVYTMYNPYHGTTDASPNFFNHLLTIRHAFSGGSAWVIQDACVSRFSLKVAVDSPVTMEFAGKGHKFGTSSVPSFTEMTGVVFPWDKFAMTANAGVYINDAAITLGTQTMNFPVRRLGLTVDNDIQYLAVMAITAGSELRSPQRGSLATAMIDIETVYDSGMTEKEADDIFGYYANKTKVNVNATGYIGTNDSIALAVTNTSGIIQSPKIDINGDGIAGMSFQVAVLPKALSDFSLTTKTAT